MDRPHLGAELAFALAAGPLGRRTLVERTGLTESVVRTELKKLEARGLVRFAKVGTELTDEAREAFGPLFRRVIRVQGLDLTELALDRHNRAAVVRGVPGEAPTWRTRDLAVREGATGAILLTRADGTLALADDDGELAEHNPGDARTLESALGPLADGDRIVIVFAPTPAEAGAGLWRILYDLVGPGAKSAKS